MEKLLIFSLVLISTTVFGASDSQTPDSIHLWLAQTTQSLDNIHNKYTTQALAVQQKLSALSNQNNSKEMLIEEIILQNQLNQIFQAYQYDLTVKRYQKGIDLIRILHEKILGLDHHFSSMKTFQDILTLVNPNTYPGFEDTKEIITSQLKKNQAIRLPALLESNPFVSASYMIMGLMIGDKDKNAKEADLDAISCILDFTLQMQHELNTIFYETEYLRTSNTALLEECYTLFEDYTTPINYLTPLKRCREVDDWDQLYHELSKTMQSMEKLQNENNQMALFKIQADLEFAVDRLLSFIDSYNRFIQMGERYYQKFELIASNYSNAPDCMDQIPIQFKALQQDIHYSIDKFDEAYNITELKGSQLKGLLYGFE